MKLTLPTKLADKLDECDIVRYTTSKSFGAIPKGTFAENVHVYLYGIGCSVNFSEFSIVIFRQIYLSFMI
ncbi:hypothetical protein CDAR_570331 [Caerostris darwini]|uniref:Uncharacterized protein n=1 Tax=Caerostris darwini TaxID=1538125 RepID=A0AAV4MCQ0_9ARAC|nr:hypothetical protein CDAR_570331 [Caerostris darwini]